MTSGRFLLGICFVASVSAGLLVFVIHLNFVVIPLLALTLGIVIYLYNPANALLWFLFALPWTSALPALNPNGYPFNYMGTPLFLLSGMIMVSMWKREHLDGRHPLAFMAALTAMIALVSAFFLILRWSNLTLAGHAFLRDTPVTPDGQRVSFAVVFPAITLMLAAISPHLFMMLRRHKLSRVRALNYLFAGYMVTLLIAVVQRFIAPEFLSRGYFIYHNQLNGGTSDFNALGFMSGFVFLAALLHQIHKEPLTAARSRLALASTALLMTAALYGLVLSGSRTGFIFVLAAAAVVLMTKKWRLRTRLLMLLCCLALLTAGGGILRHRITQTLTGFHSNLEKHGWISALDQASNQRITMLRSGLQLMRQAPVTGVGAGNFIFALKNMHFGQEHLEDLPLNQYLLFASELGVVGAILFLGLLWILIAKPGQPAWSPLLWTTLVAFLVGTPLWLPELALLFWVMAWLLDPSAVRLKSPLKRPLLTIAILFMVFALGSVLEFSRLHPLKWCLARHVPYNYGMWPPDQSVDGMPFYWTRAAAGTYLPPGNPISIRLKAEAPFHKLPQGKQTVEVHWRGRRIRYLQAESVQEWPLTLRASIGGFLEFRVHPAFNLRRMGLGREGRTLGIQVHGLIQ